LFPNKRKVTNEKGREKKKGEPPFYHQKRGGRVAALSTPGGKGGPRWDHRLGKKTEVKRKGCISSIIVLWEREGCLRRRGLGVGQLFEKEDKTVDGKKKGGKEHQDHNAHLKKREQCFL